MEQPEKLNLESFDIKQHQFGKLKQLFPEVFTEGNKVDWEKLRLTLGEQIDVGKERFGMNWPGKADCFKTIQQPSIATLVPSRKDSIDFDNTQNIFIEGDNLEVLKLLQKSYLGKIKMIYIDPPYNTGSDFIYPDNYSENLQTYLEYTGQVDSEGRKFSTNTETDGRFHSKWMNMMYPRLFLAKNLLTEDGLIFISIDDKEINNLRSLCNEIFGEENFITNLVWEKRYTRSNDAKLMSTVVDYILLYRKSDALAKLREQRNEKSDSIYTNPDDDPRGPWTSVLYVSQRTKEQRPNLSYKIKNPFTNELVEHPTNAWKYSPEQTAIYEKENKLYWGKNGGHQFPRLKKFLNELTDGLVPTNLWSHEETGTFDDGTKEVDGLLGKSIFDYPKPISLVKRMLKLVNDNEAIVLDFFAGSGTTAHAVLDLNKEDSGKRKFICVQLPEPVDEKSEANKAGYRTISDVSKERIRRAIAKMEKEVDDVKSKERETLFGEQSKKVLDLGFRNFILRPSNFNLWNTDVQKNSETIVKQLELNINHISPEAAQEVILFELLLKSGFELSTPVVNETISGKTVYAVADGELLICLEKSLTLELIKGIAEKKPSRVICLDEGFQNNDQLKTNAVQIMKSKGVIKFQTV